LAAVLLRVLQAEVAVLGELGEDLVVEPARLLPLLGVRAQLLVDEAPQRLAELLVLLGEGRVGRHGVRNPTPWRSARAWVAARGGAGTLHRVHPGVYAVGYARVVGRGRVWAAVLACGGPGKAAVSHRAAAAVYDLLPWPSGKIDVTPLGHRRSVPGVRVHRSR